jgi:hypothetical protein
MRRLLRRYRLLVVAAACFALAALLALLAADVASWRSTVARDDVRFRALHTHLALWQPSTVLPGDPAGRLLGTSSTLAWRHSLEWFWYAQVGTNPEKRMDGPTLRANAQDALLDQLSSAPTAAQRSEAANLLGVLVVTTPAPGGDQDVILQILRRATAYFQQSIELDPANLDAKQNLELVLRIQKPGKGHIGKDARSGYGFGRGQGSGQFGSGY